MENIIVQEDIPLIRSMAIKQSNGDDIHAKSEYHAWFDANANTSVETQTIDHGLLKRSIIDMFGYGWMDEEINNY
ncbi:hypothetical protein IGI04_026293 [Brassica rapa subsp. trilocularis]|uniref:Uncharacterized protein n=1 Tax=Brassica rapa subsp. trilocularis TaxID=1813537 RepID=A0ABQ7KW79_BRACM|nr:hypothetical protein IGI04_026293 [Brassica rapa subsp. trilocularis]